MSCFIRCQRKRACPGTPALELMGTIGACEKIASPDKKKKGQVFSMSKGFVRIDILESEQLMQRISAARPEVAYMYGNRRGLCR